MVLCRVGVLVIEVHRVLPIYHAKNITLAVILFHCTDSVSPFDLLPIGFRSGAMVAVVHIISKLFGQSTNWL